MPRKAGRPGPGPRRGSNGSVVTVTETKIRTAAEMLAGMSNREKAAEVTRRARGVVRSAKKR